MQILSWECEKANKTYATFNCIGVFYRRKGKLDLQPQLYIILFAAIDQQTR